ncbi:MAG TPA: hypothetical protein VGM74_21100 [Burkholderiaceae bacterium]|jgi:hypothetical protein
MDIAAPPKVEAAAPALDAGGRAVLWIFLFWQSTIVVEGPLRGALVELGQPNLLYARDLLVAGSVALALLTPAFSRAKFPAGLVLMGWLLVVHSCLGLMLSGTLFQRLFGVKIFMPLLFGVVVFPAIQRNMGLFTKAMAAFFAVTVVGVFANEFVGQWPWEGLSYATAFGTVDATREWWMAGGARRLPGFARASFDAAMIIGLTGVVLLTRVRSFWLKALIAGAGFTAIVMTTSKGMVLAFAIASPWLTLGKRSDGSLRIGKSLALSLLLVTCLVPTVFMVVSVREDASGVPEILTSLWDRFSWMWPNAYSLVPNYFGALSGVGPGGIGGALDYPQALGVPNAGDSIFVYFYVTFGLAGIVYLAFPLVALLQKTKGELEGSFAWIGLLIIAYGYGLSINMVEQAFFTSIFGLVFGAAFAALQPRPSAAADRALAESAYWSTRK